MEICLQHGKTNMRQWMIDPSKMCVKHLLGEHVEHHMFVGALNKRKTLTGYIENNLLEPKSLVVRHNALVAEMLKRGFKHNSPLDEPDISYLSDDQKNARIDKLSADTELFSRCKKCKLKNIDKSEKE